MDVSFPPEQPFEAGGISRSRRLLSEVFVLYRQNFPRWFAITAPTSLAAAFVLLMADQQIKAIFKSIPQGQIPFHLAELAETLIVRFGAFFIAWLLGAFALGAIATAVGNFDADNEEVWVPDSHQRTREHIGAVFVIALFTFCGMIVGMLGVGIVTSAIVRMVGWVRFSRFSLAAGLAGYVVVASILSWFGTAIPLIVRGNIKVWPALKRSLYLSNGYEALLLLLIVESLVGSYVGWYAVQYSFALFAPISFKYSAWYGWTLYFAAALASAAVQPPIFIGFSLLAERNPTMTTDGQASAVET